MKGMLIVLASFVCFTATLVQAENHPDSTYAEGYGALIPIDSELDYSGVDRSYLNDTDTVVNPAGYPDFPIAFPVWHPDGKRIFYTDQYGHICWVSDSGGQSHVVYESVNLYPYNGKNYVLYDTISLLVGFSPDGNTLYFVRNLYFDGEIVINLNEQGDWVGVGGTANYHPNLMSLNLNTGEVNTIATNVFAAALSHSGKYVSYRENGTLTTGVMNLESNEHWELANPNWTYFTADDESILFPGNYGSGLAKMPIWGGTKESITPFPSGYIGFSEMDMDSGGDWLLFTIMQSPLYKNSIYNLRSGKSYDVLPSSNRNTTRYARFSPDGSRFCYVRKMDTGLSSIYIKNITLPASDGSDITGIDSAAVPPVIALTGNYPNPFNPSTTISFTLPSSGPAALTVFSVTGQKVRELVDGPVNAGAHSVVWDGRDDSGETVSSGVYLSRLTQGTHTVAGKMLLAK